MISIVLPFQNHIFISEPLSQELDSIMGILNITTFLYFAYGSNLLMERIHINNPSAERAGTAKLEVSLFHIRILTDFYQWLQ